jgi:Ca-activated chloride channel homolog
VLSFAQTALSGKITDSKTGEALFAANIVLLRNGTIVTGAETDFDGNYSITGLDPGTYDVRCTYTGMSENLITGYAIKAGKANVLNIAMESNAAELGTVIIKNYKNKPIDLDNTTIGRTLTGKEVAAMPTKNLQSVVKSAAGVGKTDEGKKVTVRGSRDDGNLYMVDGVRIKQTPTKKEPNDPISHDDFGVLAESTFTSTAQQSLTTFSADVDRASYTTTRAALQRGEMPFRKGVRIEEFINYFDYNYPSPIDNKPIIAQTEITNSPWNPGLQLLRIGIQTQRTDTEKLPASNLVFLIDVSGSMDAENKLPLVKQALYLLIEQLRAIDKVAIVVYAGNSGLVLPATSGANKAAIKAALENLEAGGSTAGGAGIELAYSEALKNFAPKGNNRVILCTDGDFNVGVSSVGALQNLIEEKRKSGVFLSCLGFGNGNYKDTTMETLADKGNGNYAYIDNLAEAKKVLVNEFGGTIVTVAKDVKLQIEFNPAYVKAYRLIGYENRKLNNEDFNDDKKDAGDLGSGHSVTALYEIVPQGVTSPYLANIDALKYKKNALQTQTAKGEVATLKIRYKKPNSNSSEKIAQVIVAQSLDFEKASENMRFAAAVAQFGLLLRESEFKGQATYEAVLKTAANAMQSDSEGYRKEFLELVKTAERLEKVN